MFVWRSGGHTPVGSLLFILTEACVLSSQPATTTGGSAVDKRNKPFFRHFTAYRLTAHCLLSPYPDNFVIKVISGRKSAITMKPMMPPRTTIMIGSSRLTKLSTAVSTSSS